MLGERLKILRINAGLKQDDLLKKFGLSSARYSQYETGKRSPDYELLIKLADFYDVSLDFLLGRKESNKNEIKSKSSHAEISEKDLELLQQLKNLPADKREIVDTVIKVSDKTNEQAVSGK